MNNGLVGKTALITGAGSGIGRATALLFAERGARVVVLDVNRESSEDVVDEIRQKGGTGLAVTADVGNEAAMKQAVADTISSFGTLDVLVNNAAVQIMGPLHEFTEAQFDQIISVNMKGVFFGCKYTLPVMMKQKAGVVLSVSSVLGLVGDPDLGIYGATKGAVIALTKSLAVAYGPYGIRVNCVCPGDVNTPLVKQFFDFQPDPEEAKAQVYRHYPLRRIAEPKEVATTLGFLASEDASFISGSHLFVDGGLSAEVY
ncbi:SDR family NAD(P)-dependent oxidoreductase [Paenibacillus eucommiae]|uniref:NAD(P)-dependent dehydrogenase (Short-subunit alcohol dehydrogenase family) n=1 Tax=Paenibacillus eucommiae TaxID=1355755 RepID=A0ABS4IRY4_9BACL|nr:SDR family oxidoreductase [Paenibacillus eucommiae]MBP1990332.1 NAD(P)-dependent dehydrogenase (short-subunit alcohol dehydrogenase family) [Paenibacillus eucommiae]